MTLPVTEAKLIEGKVFAQQIQAEIKKEVEDLSLNKKILPRLAALQSRPDPASEWYINQQEKLAAKLGILFERFSPVQLASQKTLVEKIKQLNADPECHGIFIAMPLPQEFDLDQVLLALDAHKDVEGIHPTSLGLIVLRRAKLIPPTAFAALKLIEMTVSEMNKNLRGMKTVIVGQSAIVGRPLQLLLGQRRVTTIVCNTGTSRNDLQKAVEESDIVVACAGQPGLIKGEWIKPGSIVIDVGTTEVNGQLAGDIEFEEAKKRAAFITPVPGGVGPLTVTLLMRNLINAYKWQHQLTN